MQNETQSANEPIAKPRKRSRLMTLMPGGVVVRKPLPEDIRAELNRMSNSATGLLFDHISYAEARELMRHGWPSDYFGHLQRIARKAEL
jgi:hypothetical protein